MAYSVKGGPSFGTAAELHAYLNQQNLTPAAPENSWSTYTGANGVSPEQWASVVGSINNMLQGGSGPLQIGQMNQWLGPDATQQQLFDGSRMLAYQQVNPDAYPDPDRAMTDFYQGLATVASGVVGGAALGGAFGLGGGGAAGAGGLSEMTTGGATMLPGGTGQGVAAVNAAFGGAPMASLGSLGGLGGAFSDGLSQMTTGGAQMLPGGLDSLGGGSMWDKILGWAGGNSALIGGLLGAVDAHNQPDSMSQTYAPDAAMTGAGRDALAQLQALYASGGPGVAGADPASLQAIQALSSFASGNHINPYLDTVFNAGADATQNRLTSEFGRSGRNIGASLPARSQDLQHLAAGVYGQGYENERQRQYGSLMPLMAGGEYMRGINQEQMNQPLTNLAQYTTGLNGLLPMMPSSHTQPLFSNPWAGFLGGAQVGSLFGNQQG
jgi:hypothetical protein